MLSILIPTYNYNAYPLTLKLTELCALAKINFEILVLDDCSPQIVAENSQISHLKKCSYIQLKKNIGRVLSRQHLAENAKYEWLLFLDADVLPKNDRFILDYLLQLKLNYEVIFGGFYYVENKPDKIYMLRWKYGKTKEQKPANIRNKNPYKIIISANFLIKKSVFISLNSKLTSKQYGLDNYFGALLKQKNIKTNHIDNEVYHYGLDTSNAYLQKKEKAALTLLELYNEKKIKIHSNDLLSVFSSLVKYKISIIASFFYKLFNKSMRKNLTSSNPSIFVLQVYKLSFMCFKYHHKI